MQKVFVITLLIFVKLKGVLSYNYCKLEEKHCQNRRHVICHPDQMKAKAIQGGEEITSDFTVLPMTPKMRKLITDTHNEVRNSLACGKVPDKDNNTYPPAAFMRELIWDVELEYVALKHAELCVFEHDECRSTSEYPNAGQNLAVRYTTAPEDMLNYARHFIHAWYNEYELATTDDIVSLKGTPGIGHFTQLSNDRVTRLGCAITRCGQKRKVNGLAVTKYLYTCDYSFSNFYGTPTYINSSSPASNCSFIKSVKSSKYKCLCGKIEYTYPFSE